MARPLSGLLLVREVVSRMRVTGDGLRAARLRRQAHRAIEFGYLVSLPAFPVFFVRCQESHQEQR
jgi:hypothetical protein